MVKLGKACLMPVRSSVCLVRGLLSRTIMKKKRNAASQVQPLSHGALSHDALSHGALSHDALRKVVAGNGATIVFAAGGGTVVQKELLRIGPDSDRSRSSIG